MQIDGAVFRMGEGEVVGIPRMAGTVRPLGFRVGDFACGGLRFALWVVGGRCPPYWATLFASSCEEAVAARIW